MFNKKNNLLLILFNCTPKMCSWRHMWIPKYVLICVKYVLICKSTLNGIHCVLYIGVYYFFTVYESYLIFIWENVILSVHRLTICVSVDYNNFIAAMLYLCYILSFIYWSSTFKVYENFFKNIGVVQEYNFLNTYCSLL